MPRFNIETKKCEKCPKQAMIDPKDRTKCIKTNYIGLCPPDRPRYVVKSH